MALPVAGNGIRAEAQVLPTSSLTDFTLLVDLTQIPVARLTHLFNDANTSDGTRGRVSDLSNIELPFDWIDLTNQANPGFIRIKYTGTLPTTGTVGVIIYSPNTRNVAYSVSDTYGRQKTYKSEILGYYPDGGTTDRTSNGRDGTAYGGVSIGTLSGKVGAGSSYDGVNGYIEIGITPNVHSVSAWAKPADPSSTISSQTVIGTTDDALVLGAYGSVARHLIANSNYQYLYFNAGTWAADTWHMMSLTFGSTSYSYLDGIQTDTNASSSTDLLLPKEWKFGSSYSSYFFEGGIQHIFLWSSQVSSELVNYEYSQTNRNDLFWGNWSDVTIGGGYTLDADAGTYLITGSDISLLHNRVLTAESGSYNIIGADIEMSISSELAILAEAGHYEITGSDIDLIVNRVLNAESGSYNITGGDIDLTVVADKIINAESGNYNITGSDIELKIDRVLNAESGSYSIIGSDVELIWSGQPIAKGLVNISMDMKVQNITMDLKAQTITMELTI